MSKKNTQKDASSADRLWLLKDAIAHQTPDQIGKLLELYRNYLNLLAKMQINRKIRVRVDASDIVQETFLEAHRAFPSFRGTSEAELASWLRKILVRNILDHAKAQTAQKRDVKREQSLETAMDRSSEILGGALIAENTSPSEHVHQREMAVQVADAIARLSSCQQQVIVMRQVQQLQFSEIAKEMGKSPASIRMTWLRALEKLRAIMKAENEYE